MLSGLTQQSTVAKSCLVVQVNVQASHHQMVQVDEVGGDGVACLGHDATESPQGGCAHLDGFVRKWNPKAKIAKKNFNRPCTFLAIHSQLLTIA